MGDIAGNMCVELCDKTKFSYSHCGNNIVGKNVIILTCEDCGRSSKPSRVVLKSKLGLERWTRDNEVYFADYELPDSMIQRSKEVIFRRFESKFKAKLTEKTDLMSYVWRQNFNEFVQERSRAQVSTKNPTSVALQSILALVKQEEYDTMLLLQHVTFIPRFYGTCGPFYFVEYTPSLPYLGYVLYQGKLPEILSLRLKMLSWNKRASAALQMLLILKLLENADPPIYMCDLRAHNFGIDENNKVSILDTDSLEYGQIVPDDRLCYSDKDCSFITCIGKCNLTTHKCIKGPVNTHLQTLCKNIFVSAVTAFGMLRNPPAQIAEELKQTLNECLLPSKPEEQQGKSNAAIQMRLEQLLRKSLL